MDIADALTFVRDNHHAVFTTRRRDGRAQMSPVAVAADDGGRVLISSRESAIKVKNARRDPNVSLCCLNDGFFGAWCQIDGTAEIFSLPDAMELLVEYYRRVSGEHPDWDDYRSAMEREQRVVIRVTPTAAGPNVSG
jgi:PPOX class probable F420-dependent enzyme